MSGRDARPFYFWASPPRTYNNPTKFHLPCVATTYKECIRIHTHLWRICNYKKAKINKQQQIKERLSRNNTYIPTSILSKEIFFFLLLNNATHIKNAFCRARKCNVNITYFGFRVTHPPHGNQFNCCTIFLFI